MTVNRALPTTRAARGTPAAPAQAPRRSAVARTPAARLLEVQRRLGNRAVQRLAEHDPTNQVRAALRGGGAPLDTRVRGRAEAFFGADLSHVRVHTDPAAARSAEALGAEAYTSGSHVVFAEGRYDPSSATGEHRLAHELSHVVQQDEGPVAGHALGGLAISDPSDRFERAAERDAGAFDGGECAPGARARPTDPASADGLVAVQRTLTTSTVRPGTPPADVELAEKFFTAYDRSTEEAYAYIKKTPGLGKRASSLGNNGQLREWLRQWTIFHDSGGRHDPGLAKFMGTAIENLVTKDIEFKPNYEAPAGYKVIPQFPADGTIPDFALVETPALKVSLAWLDITATNSKDHVVKAKSDWEGQVPIFAESLYTSLTLGDLAGMYLSHKTALERRARGESEEEGGPSDEELQAYAASIDKKYEEDRAANKVLGLNYRYSKVKSSLEQTVRAVMEDDDGLKRETLCSILQRDFGSEPLEPAMAANILWAMWLSDPNLKEWGFGTGFVPRRRLGELWLEGHPRPATGTVEVKKKRPLKGNKKVKNTAKKTKLETIDVEPMDIAVVKGPAT